MKQRYYSRTLTLKLVVLCLALCGGCATGGNNTSKAQSEVSLSDLRLPAPVKKLKFTLDQDPLYLLLIAEFAGQRGHHELSIKHYLSLALTFRMPALAERATRIALFEGRYERALEAAEIWVSLEHLNLDARQILAAMLIRGADVEAAVKQLVFILENDHEYLSDRLRMITSLLGSEEDRVAAFEVMERLLDRFEQSTDALHAYVFFAVRAAELEKAADSMILIEKATDLNPNLALMYLGEMQKKGMLLEAASWLEELFALNPRQPELRPIYARLLAEIGRFEDSVAEFRRLDELQPNTGEIVFAIGLLELHLGKLEEASLRFSHLLRLGQDRIQEANYYLGQISEHNHDYAEAVMHYSAVTAGMVYFDSRIRSAFLLSRINRGDEALQVLGGIVPGNEREKMEVFRARGEILIEQKRYTAAMEAFNAGLDLTTNEELLYARAMLGEKIGRIDIVERDLRAILKADPENVQALNALGYTLADRTERYEEAHVLITRALKLDPTSFYILDSMGWVLYRLGRLDEAAEYLWAARDLKNDPEVASHLGEVLWMSGNPEAAQEVWNSALEANPNAEKILDVMKKFKP